MTKSKSWRDVLPIHPAAELFPRMSPDELRVLGEDIKKNGLKIPVTVWCGKGEPLQLLDGRNRLDAMEAVDIPIKRLKRFIEYYCEAPMVWEDASQCIAADTNPYEYVISANIHRRHLTAEQKRDLIAKLIKATPEKSDRQIAETVKASPTTVGTVRAEMEAKGDVSKLDTRTDTKGRQQPVKKSAPKPPPEKKPTKRDDRIISQAAADACARFANKLIRVDIDLARELAAIIISETGVPQHLWIDLTTGINIEETELAALDDGRDPGPLPESLRRRS
jgi:ParB-like chromosome segregation protein Spo0J